MTHDQDMTDPVFSLPSFLQRVDADLARLGDVRVEDFGDHGTWWQEELYQHRIRELMIRISKKILGDGLMTAHKGFHYVANMAEWESDAVHYDKPQMPFFLKTGIPAGSPSQVPPF